MLVLGSDGLWDACGNAECVGLVRDTVKDPILCAKRLVTEALTRGGWASPPKKKVKALIACSSCRLHLMPCLRAWM